MDDTPRAYVLVVSTSSSYRMARAFLLCMVEDGWMATTCGRRQRERVQRGRERERGAHLLRDRVPIRAVFLAERRVGKKAADERVEDRLVLVADALLAVAETKALDALAQLLARIEHAEHGLVRHEVVAAPRLALVALVELLERAQDVEELEVVASAVDELLPCGVGLVARGGRVDQKLVLGPEEGHEVDDLARAALGERGEEDASVDGIERELHHLPTDRGDAALRVERVEAMQRHEGERDCGIEDVRFERRGYRAGERGDALESLSGLSMK